MKHTRRVGHSSMNKTRKNHGSTSVKKQIITNMLQMLMTVKLYHWNTLSFSVHKATDTLYGVSMSDEGISKVISLKV